jgi:hypothetical protein
MKNHGRVSALVPKIKRAKVGTAVIEIAEVSKRIIEEYPDAQERERLSRSQIVIDNKYYRLYANGVMVQRVKISIKARERDCVVTFPFTFPNEVPSAQVVGNIGVVISELNNGNLTMHIDPEAEDREVKLVLSGV